MEVPAAAAVAAAMVEVQADSLVKTLVHYQDVLAQLDTWLAGKAVLSAMGVGLHELAAWEMAGATEEVLGLD